MRKQNRVRALRNLFIAALLLLFLWYLEGCPLPTEEMELHRNERQHLLPESRVVWTYRGSYGSDRDMLVGVGENHISTHLEPDRSWFWEKNESGPTLVLLPEGLRYHPDGKASSLLAPAFLVMDAPSRTQKAVLHVRLDFNSWSEVYDIEGEKQGAVWLFQVQPRYYATDEYTSDEGWSRHNSESHALSLLRSDGQTGNTHTPCTVEFFHRDGTCIATLDVNGGVAAEDFPAP